MAGGIKLAPLLTEIKVDIENFKSDMEKAAAIGTSEAKRISQEMETTAKVGEKFSKAGDLLTKGLTLPIVGVGAATTKMAVDFESSFAKVSTLLDSNVVDFAQYKNELLNASSETKVSGLNIVAVKPLFKVLLDMSTINKDLSELQLYHDKKTLTPTDLGLNTGIWKVIANNSYKIGNAIHLNMEIYTTSIIVANNVYNNAFTIPSQYRPLIDTAVNVTASDGAYKNPVACTSLAKANGNLFFCIPKATNNYLFIDAEWECA